MTNYSLLSIADKQAISFNDMEYIEAVEEIIQGLSKLYHISIGEIIDGPGSKSCLLIIGANQYSVTNNSYGTFLISLSADGDHLLKEITDKIFAVL